MNDARPIVAPPRRRPGHEKRLPARFALLSIGMLIQGVGLTLVFQANLGVGAWDVLHAGLVSHTGLSVGTVIALVALAALVLWWPLKERPHIGTVLNVFVIDILMAHSSAPAGLEARTVYLVAGILLFGIGQGMYLAPRLGVGAREGLMTGLNRRFGMSITSARVLIEVSTLALGIVLGGPAGIGTVLFTVCLGPLVGGCPRLFGHVAPADLDGRQSAPDHAS